MLFASKKENIYHYFVDLIDENIHLFGETVREKLSTLDKENLTDDEFVACYVEGMNRMVTEIYTHAATSLNADAKCFARFRDAVAHPERYGLRLPNENMTIGKIYLCYMIGKSRSKAHRTDCIKLERYAVGLIGRECLACGLLH